MRWWEQLREKVNTTYNDDHHSGNDIHEIKVADLNNGPVPWKHIEDSINQYYDKMQNKNTGKAQRELIKMRKDALNEAYARYVGFWGGEWMN